MDADEMAVREQLEAHKKRLRILQERAALQGLSTPPETIIEIEDILRKIQHLEETAREEPSYRNSVSNKPKYYIYLSKTKVDMLFSQLPDVTVSDYTSEASYPSKLSVVLDYLEKHQQIGSIDDPDTYFKGTLLMRWGPILDIKREYPSGVVYFFGETNNTILGLGGSLFHVVGAKGQWNGACIGYSHAHQIIDNLREYIVTVERKLNVKDILLDIHELYGQGNKILDKQSKIALETVLATKMYTEGSLEQLEFFARRLIHGRSKGRQIILGTPLYVALAD